MNNLKSLAFFEKEVWNFFYKYIIFYKIDMFRKNT